MMMSAIMIRLSHAAWRRTAPLHRACGHHRACGAAFATATGASPPKPRLSFASDVLLDPRGEGWLARQDTDKWQRQWAEDGYIVVPDLVPTAADVDVYRGMYDDLVSGRIDAGAHRHDLGSNEAQKRDDDENVCQIMWPSDYFHGHWAGPLHVRTAAVARLLLEEEGEGDGDGDGDDPTVFDFDMLIYKAAHTDTAVPWHQDAGYWPSALPDTRAVSCWVALDDATVDNGCMWFVPGSHRGALLPHAPAAEGSHVLAAEGVGEEDGLPVPLAAGSATFHAGRTLHYTRGNTTAHPRRAYITNYRPAAMVAWERAHGFDHGRAGMDSIDYSTVGGFEGREATIKQKDD